MKIVRHPNGLSLVVGAGALGGGGYRVDRVYQIGCLSGAGNCIVAAAPAQAGGAPPAAGMFGGIQGGIGTAPGFTVSPTHLCLSPIQPSALAGPSIGFGGNFGPAAVATGGAAGPDGGCHPPIDVELGACHPGFCCQLPDEAASPNGILFVPKLG